MAANSGFKPTEGKREEFRRYLEKTGVMDALTKVLVSLYEEQEKPTDALTYIQNKLALQSGGETLDSLKTQLAQVEEKALALEKENAELKAPGNIAGDRPTPPQQEVQQAQEESPAQPTETPTEELQPTETV